MASVSAIEDENQTNYELNHNNGDSECCSFVIQEENETVFAFRQDAPLNGYGVNIHNDTWDDLEIIREEIDTPGSYFTHAVITQDGWVFSQGGSQYADDNRAIEQIVREMILSDNISSDSLGDIQIILKKFNYGHVLIKAPDGRYGVVYYNIYFSGTLQQGEFLIVPNIYDFFRYGNYNGYAIDPVNSIVEICSYEDSGWNRRNLYVYDYKAYDTDNGQKYGIDIYATNDNGLNVGLNTTHIVTHFIYNDEFYPESALPEMPETMHVATYIFENQSVESVFEVVNSLENTLINQETNIEYRINNICEEKTVVFELDDNIEFINADVSQGDYYYDLSQHALYWNLSSSNSSKTIFLSIKPKVKGNYLIHSYIQGMDENIDVGSYATDYGAIITANNVTTYKSYYKSLNIYLTDDDGVPLIGEPVWIEINGTTYNRIVTPKGYAELAIMLQPGKYDALISYDGIFGQNQTASKITVNKTLFSSDLEYFYGEISEFNVSCLDGNGNILTGFEIDFRLDGVLKGRYADDNGIATLNISNLKPGNHSITSFNLATNEYVDNTIYVSSISANDVVKVYRNDTQYFATFVDGNGTLLTNTNVSFNINGVSYIRTTDDNGTAKLNINLNEGTYILTAINLITGDVKTNNIAVIGLFESNNLIKYYKNDSQFVVRVLAQNGSYVGAGEEVTFNINGVFYTRTTNSTGHATLNINLNPGNYTISTYYKGYACADNIEVLPILLGSDLNMKYHDGSKFEATLFDGQGNPYSGQNITFNINGVFYNRTTDKNGIAQLNINLMPGEYIITSIYEINKAITSNKITIES